ncbi:hypothetical protein MPLDJ20_220057 [Mesorhizobium plurifarium]|uniref:Uncharacterized protein n=1 Tax=Mesorhizobium plurifarium TaxID=69974 RepID=A0A090F8U2_MESPL|nr:hypothetical protein MPLSOD_200036 [Mesorhizobium sp. SOD10]CDX38106.1 hypothetical protein MPLDJ20_220057 [Mesorhizobium plurifarium]
MVRGQALLTARKVNACPKPDNGGKYVGFNTTGRLRRMVGSSEITHCCTLSTLAQPLPMEMRQHWMRQD